MGHLEYLDLLTKIAEYISLRDFDEDMTVGELLAELSREQLDV